MAERPKNKWELPRLNPYQKFIGKLDSDDPREAIPAWLAVYISLAIIVVASINDLLKQK